MRRGDRRYRLYYIDENELIALLKLGGQLGSAAQGRGEINICLPRNFGAPEGSTVESVHHDHMRKALAILVHHKSFDSIPDCKSFPESCGELEWQNYHLRFEFGNITRVAPVRVSGPAKGIESLIEEPIKICQQLPVKTHAEIEEARSNLLEAIIRLLENR